MICQTLNSDALGCWKAHQPVKYKLAPAPLEGVGTFSLTTSSPPSPIIYHIILLGEVSSRRHLLAFGIPVAGQDGRAINGMIWPSLPVWGTDATRVAAEPTPPSVARKLTWQTAKAAPCPATTGNGGISSAPQKLWQRLHPARDHNVVARLLFMSHCLTVFYSTRLLQEKGEQNETKVHDSYNCDDFEHLVDCARSVGDCSRIRGEQ